MAKQKDPYTPSVYGHGYIGVMSNGVKPTISVEGELTKEYVLWSNIMKRLFSSSYHSTNPSYKHLGYSEEILCYAYFLEFVLPNIPNYKLWVELGGAKVHLDKDILGAKNGRCGYYINNLMFVYAQDNIKESKTRHSHTGCVGEAKPVRCINIHSQEVFEFESIREASRQIGVCQSNISRCCKGERKSAGGYIWRYVEEDER